jgi:hypothetical protein
MTSSAFEIQIALKFFYSVSIFNLAALGRLRRRNAYIKWKRYYYIRARFES